MDFKFQVNLRGIIDLLSNHLYSGPDVFVRELLQNGTDAIQARRKREPGFKGRIEIEVTENANPERAMIVFSDNGIGLSEQDVHSFLATIGSTSKREDLESKRSDFLGQFGIGLLACFLVSDEIVIISKSIRQDCPAVEWRGRPDGTYSLRVLETELEPGTQVFLRGRKTSALFFKASMVRSLALKFGRLLPWPIHLNYGTSTEHINSQAPPWKRLYSSKEEEFQAYVDFGTEIFDSPFTDVIPIESEVGEVEGAAYILAHSPSPASRPRHHVYLKGMLLSESTDNLLPEWAFFVQCVVNAHDLRPTASRESFYEDETLEIARTHLGNELRDFIVRLSQNEPERLARLILVHYDSIKALAVHDEEFFGVFADLLPFDTTAGTISLGEYRRLSKKVYYSPTVDQFREVARIAASLDMLVINAGHTHDIELLERLPRLFPDLVVEQLDSATLVENLGDLGMDERLAAHDFLCVADVVLRPFNCRADIKRFQPVDIPSLYTSTDRQRYNRTVERTREIVDSLWNSLIDSTHESYGDSTTRLCFNYNNPLVERLVGIRDRNMLRVAIEMLYVQTLLLGHHPLTRDEMTLLNHGLIDLINMGITAGETT